MFQSIERVTLAWLPIAAALSLAACSKLAPGPATLPDLADANQRASAGAVLARIDGHPIHQGEVERWLKDDWLREIEKNPVKLYEMHRAGLEGVIDDSLIELAAAREGLSSEAFLARETAALGPVTAEEVDSFYQRNKHRIEPVEPIEQLRPKIREFLEADRPVRVVSDLRRAATIEVLLRQPPSAPIERVRVPAGGASRGPVDAPVTIVEFSDYQCPFCQRAEATLRQLEQLFPGKLRFVYRHFPLEFHSHALPAAKAAVCAGEQAQFWDYHELLFANQRSLSVTNLVGYAAQLGLDAESFLTCLDADATRLQIEQDMSVAKALGATATPTFFINGVVVHGAQSLQTFRRIVEREIAESSAP